MMLFMIVWVVCGVLGFYLSLKYIADVGGELECGDVAFSFFIGIMGPLGLLITTGAWLLQHLPKWSFAKVQCNKFTKWFNTKI